MNKFQDKEWVASWERWHKAKTAWEKTRLVVPFRELGAGVYNPEPEKISDLHQRSVAQEFVEARRLYRAQEDRFQKEED